LAQNDEETDYDSDNSENENTKQYGTIEEIKKKYHMHEYEQHAQTLNDVSRQLDEYTGDNDIRSLMEKDPFEDAMCSSDDDNINNGIDDDNNLIDEDDNNINNNENDIDNEYNGIDAVTADNDIINVNDDDNSRVEDSGYLLPTDTYNSTSKNVTPISGSVAASSLTNSDGSLNLTNLHPGMKEDDMIRIIQNLTKQNMELKSQKKSSKNVLPYNPLVETTVKNVVKNDLFPKVQFIRHDELFHDYKNRTSVGKFVMDHLNIENDEKKRGDFWETYKQVVRRQIKIQRNVVHTALKRKFFGK